MDHSFAGNPQIDLSQLQAHGLRLWVSAQSIFQLKGLVGEKNPKNICHKRLTMKLLIYWNASLLNYWEIFPVAFPTPHMWRIAFVFMFSPPDFIGETFMLIKYIFRNFYLLPVSDIQKKMYLRILSSHPLIRSSSTPGITCCFNSLTFNSTVEQTLLSGSG